MALNFYANFIGDGSIAEDGIIIDVADVDAWAGSDRLPLVGSSPSDPQYRRHQDDRNRFRYCLNSGGADPGLPQNRRFKITALDGNTWRIMRFERAAGNGIMTLPDAMERHFFTAIHNCRKDAMIAITGTENDIPTSLHKLVGEFNFECDKIEEQAKLAVTHVRQRITRWQED